MKKFITGFLTLAFASLAYSAITISEWSTSNVFVIDNNRNVGIATTAPSNKLYVGGNIETPYGIIAATATIGSISLTTATVSYAAVSTASITSCTITGLTDTYLTVLGTSSFTGLVTASAETISSATVTNLYAQYLTVSSTSTFGSNIGIGTTSTTEKLSIQGQGTSYSLFVSTNATGTTPNFVITNAGNLGVGTTAPLTLFHVVETSTLSPRGIVSQQISDDTNGARVGFMKARGTTTAPTVVVNGDMLGRLMFRGYDGSNYLEMGSVDCAADSTIASTKIPTRLTFNTGDTATPSVLQERVRITSNGNVGIGTTAPSTPLEVRAGTDGTINALFTLNKATSSYYGNYISFKFNGSEKYRAGFNAHNPSNGEYSYAIYDAGASVTRILINSNGNVGIGTTAMTEKLEVFNGNIKTNYGVSAVTGTFSTSLASPQLSATSASGLALYDDGGNGMFVIDGGNVGIGTNVAGAGLVVKASSGYIWMKPDRSASANARNWGLHVNNAVEGNLDFYVSTSNGGAPAAPRVSFDLNGNVGIGTSLPQGNLNVSKNSNSPAWTKTYFSTSCHIVVGGSGFESGAGNGELYLIGFGYNASPALDLYLPAYIGAITTSNSARSTADIVMGARRTTTGSVAPIEIMRLVATTGNVGIGTTAPADMLEVYGGNIRATYGINVATAIVSSNVGIGTTVTTNKLTVFNGNIQISTSTGSNGIYFQDGSLQTRAYAPVFVSSTNLSSIISIASTDDVYISTITVTLTGGKNIGIIGLAQYTSDSAKTHTMSLYDGVTLLQSWTHEIGAGDDEPLSFMYFADSATTAGSHTYTFRVHSNNASGTQSVKSYAWRVRED